MCCRLDHSLPSNTALSCFIPFFLCPVQALETLNETLRVHASYREHAASRLASLASLNSENTAYDQLGLHPSVRTLVRPASSGTQCREKPFSYSHHQARMSVTCGQVFGRHHLYWCCTTRSYARSSTLSTIS